MAETSLWLRVKDNAERQVRLAREKTGDPEVDIGAFYPELFQPEIPEFSTTFGSHLIADVLTSECVLVDLYDWQDPSGLIEAYGVDVAFLQQLRDSGHVVLCANLPVDRYQQTAWLHTILADERTIFRSERTPQFFVARDKDFFETRNDLKHRLLKDFQNRSAAELDLLAGLVNPTHPLKGAENIADVLAYWAVRLKVVNPDAAALVDAPSSRPQQVIPEIRLRQVFDVSPTTVGLGGYYRVKTDELASAFADRLDFGAIPENARATIVALNDCLARMRAKVAYSDLTGERYWRNLTDFDRSKILSRLNDKEKRAGARRLEEVYRRELLRSHREGWSPAQIERLIKDERDRLDRLLKYGQGLMAAASLAAIVVGSKDLETFVAVAGGAGTVLGSIFARKLVRKTIPKIHLVDVIEK